MYVSELISWKGGCYSSSNVLQTPCSAVCCRLHAYGVNVAANEDAGSVVRGARTHASRAEPINGQGSHHWLRSNFTPLSLAVHSTSRAHWMQDMHHLVHRKYIAAWFREVVQCVLCCYVCLI